MNSFRYGSRILKETATLVRSGLARHVYIAGIHEEGLREHEEIDDGREIWRARLRTRKWSRRLPVQLLKYLEFCIRTVRYARGKKIGFVNIHSLPLLPLGALLKLIYKAKLVYDAHELESETYGLTGVRQVMARMVERIFIGHADLVIVVGGFINEWYRRKYGLSNIVTVLNCPEFQEPQRSQRFHRELGIPEKKKIVLYQGGLVRGRGVEPLLEAFAGDDDGRHVLVLMGYGELVPLIREYKQSHDNIFFKEAVEPHVLLEYTASADIGIAYIDNSSLNDQYCLPNKLFEYTMAGLPIIVNNVPEMRRVVNENRIGVVLDDLNARSLARALSEIGRMDSGCLMDNLRRAAERYSWNHQAQSMINAYQQYVFRGSRSACTSGIPS